VKASVAGLSAANTGLCNETAVIPVNAKPRTNTKTDTSEVLFFILSSFQSLSPRTRGTAFSTSDFDIPCSIFDILFTLCLLSSVLRPNPPLTSSSMELSPRCKSGRHQSGLRRSYLDQGSCQHQCTNRYRCLIVGAGYLSLPLHSRRKVIYSTRHTQTRSHATGHL
jgi:hypothetical protein